MRTMPLRARLHNRTTGEMLSETAFLMTSLRDRFFGMLSPGLPPSAVVGLTPCDWIHTFGLRRPLDIAYCDADGQVLDIAFGMPPHQLGRRVRGTHTVWEAPDGSFAGHVSLGDVLQREIVSQTAESVA